MKRYRLLSILALLPALVASAAQPTAEEAAQVEAACPTTAPARPKAPRRVLVFSRNEGFDHTAIGVGALAIDTLGRKTGAYSATHSTDLSVLSAENLRPYDAIVFNNGYGFKLTDPKARAALLAFVRGGKGVIGIHAASANFEGWPEGSELFGARFHSHPWTPVKPWPVRNEQPKHPLNEAFGGRGFSLTDEIYTFTDFRRDRVRVLLSLDLSDPVAGGVAHPHPYVPVSWIYPLGQGRAFFASLGHQHEDFWSPPYLRHLLAGIQYALGDLAAPGSPDAAAVARLVSSADAAEARDSKETLDRLTSTPAQRAAAEQVLLEAVAKAPPGNDLADLIDSLSHVASDASVPRLAPWLLDPERSHAARRVLQRLATPAARQALRDALAKANGALAAGLAGSLADLRDAAAVPLIKPLLASADLAVVQAGLLSLGRLATADAAQTLLDAKVPAALETVLDDAMVGCAATLASAGAKAQAEALYAALSSADRPTQARVAGLQGLVALGSPRAVGLMGACLDPGDPRLAMGAARLLDRVASDVVVGRALAAYPSLPPSVQAPLLAALGRRAVPAALPLADAALASDEPGLRQAAVSALGASGQLSAIAPLAAFAARSERDERRWATDALTALHGTGVDAALAKACGQGDAPSRAMLLGVLAARHQTGAAALLLKASADADPTVAIEALRGLGRIGAAADLAPLAKLLLATGDAKTAGAIGDAIVTIARRQPSREQAVAPLISALQKASPAARAVLLPVIAECGGKAAVTALTAALADADGTVHAAALTALAEVVDDPAAAPALLRLARAGDGADGLTALRGWLRVLAANAADDAVGTVKSLAGAMDLLKRVEERRQALGVLRWCRVPAAMTLAATLLDQPDTMAEAVATIRHLAAPQRAEGRQLPAVTGAEAVAALDRVGAVKDAHLPKPWRSDDIGTPQPAGSAAFEAGRWTLRAAGTDFYSERDGGFMLWQRRAGDCTITAKVISHEKTDVWTKAGVMLRANLEAGSPYVAVMVSGNPQGVIQQRPTPGAQTAYEYIPATAPYWVRLRRQGNHFTCFISADGADWRQVGERDVALPAEAYAGFALSSHKDGTLTTAVVESLEITAP